MKDYERLKMLEYPKGIIDVVIDTDAATEVDDPFAIALALLSPENIGSSNGNGNELSGNMESYTAQ